MEIFLGNFARHTPVVSTHKTALEDGPQKMVFQDSTSETLFFQEFQLLKDAYGIPKKTTCSTHNLPKSFFEFFCFLNAFIYIG